MKRGRVEVKPRSGRLRCAYCHDLLGAGILCAGCRTRYHEDCHRELGGCATLGCASRKLPVPRGGSLHSVQRLPRAPFGERHTPSGESYPRAVFRALFVAHEAFKFLVVLALPGLSAVVFLDLEPLLGEFVVLLAPLLWFVGLILFINASEVFCAFLPRLSPYVDASRGPTGRGDEAIFEPIRGRRVFSLVFGLALLIAAIAAVFSLGAASGVSVIGRIVGIVGLVFAALLLWGRVATGGAKARERP